MKSLIVVLYVHLLGQTLGQPLTLDVDIREVGKLSQTLQIEDDKPRTVALVPGLAYEFVCTTSSGDFTNDAWYNNTSTDQPITSAAPQPDSTPAVFVTSGSNVNPAILKVQAFDATLLGTYSCIKGSLIRSITLEQGNPVVIPAKTNITLTEGDTSAIFIQALVSSTSAVASVTWKHNNTVITPASTNKYLDINISSSSVYDLITQGKVTFDYSGELSVEMVTMDGSTASASMSVRVIAAPKVTIVASPSIPIIGDIVTLTCEDTNAVPAPTLSWSVDGSDIMDGVGGYSIQTNSYTSVLTISPALFNHSNTYTCKAVNEADTVSVSHTLTLLLPQPDAPATTISPPTGPYYSGSTITLTCTTTLTESSLYSGTLVPVFNWTRGDMEYVDSDLVTVTVTNVGGLVYTSELTLCTSIIDSGVFMCSVRSTTAVDNHNSRTVSTVAGTLNIEDPLLSLSLTPDSAIVPNLGPYFTVTLTCIADIPQQVTIDHTFFWLRNNNVINDDGIIVHNGFSSTLSVNASTPGDVVYSCCLHLPLHHSPITVTRNATITVTGPSSPATPTNVDAFGPTYNSVTILWTIPSIVYSPETYLVRYGTTRNSLTMQSRVQSSGSDFTATNKDYQVQLEHLEQDRIYYYTVEAENQHSISQSSVESFRTTSLDIVQVKAGPFLGCNNGRVLDDANVMSFISEQLSKVVETRCNCTYPSSQFINSTLLCTAADSNNLVYRAYVLPHSNTITSTTIVGYIGQWVSTGPAVLSCVAEIVFDPTCAPTVLHIQGDDVCVDEPTPTVGAVDSNNILDSNIIILLAVILGAFIVFLIFIVVLLVVLAIYQCKRIRYLTRKRRSEYSIVRRASLRSSVRGSSVPPVPPSGNDWKKQGEVYVTTECPAYLASYQPKPDVVDVDREPTPCIYDSIDTNLQGRGLRPPQSPVPPPPPV